PRPERSLASCRSSPSAPRDARVHDGQAPAPHAETTSAPRLGAPRPPPSPRLWAPRPSPPPPSPPRPPSSRLLLLGRLLLGRLLLGLLLGGAEHGLGVELLERIVQRAEDLLPLGAQGLIVA